MMWNILSVMIDAVIDARFFIIKRKHLSISDHHLFSTINLENYYLE